MSGFIPYPLYFILSTIAVLVDRRKDVTRVRGAEKCRGREPGLRKTCWSLLPRGTSTFREFPKRRNESTNFGPSFFCGVWRRPSRLPLRVPCREEYALISKKSDVRRLLRPLDTNVKDICFLVVIDPDAAANELGAVRHPKYRLSLVLRLTFLPSYSSPGNCGREVRGKATICEWLDVMTMVVPQ
jgi:hypothetical protein